MIYNEAIKFFYTHQKYIYIHIYGVILEEFEFFDN